MSARAINKEIERIDKEITAIKNKYKAYSKQEKQSQNKKINKEIAKFIVEKRTLEAMLKFVKEQ